MNPYADSTYGKCQKCGKYDHFMVRSLEDGIDRCSSCWYNFNRKQEQDPEVSAVLKELRQATHDLKTSNSHHLARIHRALELIAQELESK